MNAPFKTGRCGGSRATATEPVWPSTSGTTAPTPTLTGASESKCSAPARLSSYGPAPETPCSAGASSSTTAASWELTAPSSEMKARRSRHSLSDRQTLSLITSGLVSGITPTSVRKQCGAAIPDTVSWPLAGSAAGAPRAASSSLSEPTFTRQPPLKTGFHPPEQCARGRSDCRSLAQILSSDAATFMCCGEVAPGSTPWPADKWAFCLRGREDRPGVEGTDVRFFVDRRDLSHMAAVTAMGLATVIPEDQPHDPA